MSPVPRVKLGSICSFVSKGTTPTTLGYDFEEAGIPFLRVQNLIGGSVDITDCLFINDETNRVLSRSVIQSGDVLISIAGTIGRVAIVPDGSRPMNCNQAVGIVRPTSAIDRKYLAMWLGTDDAMAQIDSSKVTATISNLSLGQIKELAVPLPPLATQQHIARVLEQADLLRKQAQQMEYELNQLAQSLFLEMFGDPATNEKSWPQLSLAQLTTKIGSGSTPTGGKEAYQDIGISLIRSLNVHDGEFLYKNLARIDDQQANALSNVVVEPQDVLLNITGASVCRCCVVPHDVLPARVNQHVAILRPDTAKLTTAYLQALIVSPSFKALLLRLAGAGATREALTKGTLEDLQIPKPPLDKQIAFENAMNGITKQIEAIKVKQRQLDSLFASLMQRAFNGELTAPERKAA